MLNENTKGRIKHIKRTTDATLKDITENQQTFKKFLQFQAKLYKHRFEDAVLLYAYNPNIYACGEIEQ